MPCETCKQSYLDSYQVTVETIRQAQPGISEHDLRVAAAVAYRPKYAAWKQSEIIENSGLEKYQNGEFMMLDGKMYFPKTGDFAETPHENQLLSSQLHNDPGRYSKADHERTLLVQQSIASGARVVRTMFDGNNGSHRDMVEYIYDPVTNRGKVVVYDLSKQYGLLNESRMKQAVFGKSAGLRAVVQSENVFVLTDAPAIRPNRIETVGQTPERSDVVDKGQIRKIDTHEPAPDRRNETQSPSGYLIHHSVETVGIVRRRMIVETKEAVRGVKQSVALKTKEAPVAISARPLRVKDMAVNHVTRARRQRQELMFIGKTGSAYAAVPLILRSFAEVPPKAVRAVEKSIARHEKKVPAFAAPSPKRLWRVGDEAMAGKREVKKIQRILLKPRVEQIVKRKKERNKKRRTKAYIEHPTGYRIYTNEKTRKTLPEKKRKSHTEKRLKRRREMEIVTTPTRTKERRRKIRLERGRSGRIFEAGRLPKREASGIFPKRKHERKIHRTKENKATRWVLLSIVWYLTAIREQGRGYAVPPKRRQFPQQAVIFAYQ